ncbi:INO80 complex subunit D [Phymastichus coffea]|uniref:INO80 complex subunit D n=1 Tax=Phymastichus coffea TaxID=108790 RepID=UPI00273C76D4|nr:INO80 complex subunit D [Phymastichus coffea]
MKILNSKQSNMDNKLKFADRFKVLLNSEIQKGIDPYVFNETEQQQQQQQQPLVSTGGKNIKLIAPKNSKTPSSNKNRSKGKCLKTKIKAEPMPIIGMKAEPSLGFAAAAANNTFKSFHQPSAYPAQQKQRYIKKLQRLKAKRKSRDHTLQYYPRAGDEISDSESSADELQTYQRHWYSGESDPTSARSSRLAQLHSQLQRQLQQLQHADDDVKNALREKTRCLLKAAHQDPSAAARILNDANASSKIVDGPLIVGGACGAEGCQQLSLPCTRHCSRHIMMNPDQLLFEHCTAKFSDNTQCCVPVFDVAHELPLCPEHARKRDNYHRRAQESKPKKARSKKPSSPSVSGNNANLVGANSITSVSAARPSKSKSSKPKKRKRPPSRNKPEASKQQHQQPVIAPVHAPVMPQIPMDPAAAMPAQQLPPALLPDDIHHFANSLMTCNNDMMHTKTLNNLNALPQPNAVPNLNSLGLDISSLGLSGLKVELDDHEVFASLDHATEHDFENVLNNLPADAFNDLFIEGRNGDYEPTREEEEELERAVEAFDKDVRNLERLGQTHGLLEPALLAQLMSDIAS